jgi:hypothetical protein
MTLICTKESFSSSDHGYYNQVEKKTLFKKSHQYYLGSKSI